MSPSRAPPPDGFPPGARGSDGEKKILVVEDSGSARKILQELLLGLGVTLPNMRMAATAAEALQLFTQWRPDIVFVDLQLTPGWEVSRPTGPSPSAAPRALGGADLALQMLRRDPAVKIVICSATDPARTELGALVGKDRVFSLLKPLLAEKVLEVLETLGAVERHSATPYSHRRT
jgi:CheY-like chemotaxis protein